MRLISSRLGAAFVLMCVLTQRVSADNTVAVHADDTLVQWEGWGTSLCWWAYVFGERADVADVHFTLNDSVSLGNGGPANLPALGFNIARYNVGGSGNNVIHNKGKEERMKVSENMPAYKAIETYWLDWFSTDPTSSSWNWDADPRQRAMVVSAKARGLDQLELFSNSPPWWMTKNHAAAGADTFGLFDNLQNWNYEQFAIYLATVAEYARDHWGFEFNYVEPVNEPTSGWWLFPGKQEGCHVLVTTQNETIRHLRRHLDGRGLESVKIAASERVRDARGHVSLEECHQCRIQDQYPRLPRPRAVSRSISWSSPRSDSASRQEAVGLRVWRG